MTVKKKRDFKKAIIMVMGSCIQQQIQSILSIFTNEKKYLNKIGTFQFLESHFIPE